MGGIMSIVLQGSTSGSVTLQEPAVAGTTVLDLPAVSGTILTTTSPKAGNVLQVVQASTTTRVQITNSTYVDTNLTASITPSSSSSKILVLISQNIGTFNSSQVGTAGNLRIVRDSTTVFTSENVISIVAALGNASEVRVAGQYAFNYLDSPATTSSVTYKTQANLSSGGGRVEPQSNNGTSNSTIILMEIAG
jgi:hypothetical protein